MRTARGCGPPAATSRAASSTTSTSTTRAKCRRSASRPSSSTCAKARRPIPRSCPSPCLQKARHMVQVSSKYRPRLQEIDEELRRRIGDAAEILALDGAFRNPRYSSPGDGAITRTRARRRGDRDGSARTRSCVPMRKTRRVVAEEHARAPLVFLSARRSRERDAGEGARAGGGEGHPDRCSAASITTPTATSGPASSTSSRYFECDDESLPVFDQVLNSLRDLHQNPGVALRGRRTDLERQTGPSLVSLVRRTSSFKCSRRMSRPKSPLKSRQTE